MVGNTTRDRSRGQFSSCAETTLTKTWQRHSHERLGNVLLMGITGRRDKPKPKPREHLGNGWPFLSNCFFEVIVLSIFSSVIDYSPWIPLNFPPDYCLNGCTFPSSSERPRTCAMNTPRQIWMLGTRPRKPRRLLGAISPRYIGTTLRQIPERQKRKKDHMCPYF